MKKKINLYPFIRAIIGPIFRFLYNPQVINISNIPEKGNYILAGNHTNKKDCLLLGSIIPRNIHYISKKELTEGWKKIIFNHIGLIPVDRKGKNNTKAFQEAFSTLNYGEVIAIFPEGTINRTEDKLMKLKNGAAIMANNTNSKIIPFYINGKYKLFGHELKIVFGKYFYVNEDIEKGTLILTNKLLNLMEEQQNERKI